jgi:formylglycine-generating enzyme required for sulfatase activity
MPPESEPSKLVWIPPGTFTMGSSGEGPGPQNCESEEPQTQVTISRGFWMGRYEVTQAEYLEVMGTNPSSHKGDLNLPVEYVTWDEAVAYCEALTERERQEGRLSTGYRY